MSKGESFLIMLQLSYIQFSSRKWERSQIDFRNRLIIHLTQPSRSVRVISLHTHTYRISGFNLGIITAMQFIVVCCLNQSV